MIYNRTFNHGCLRIIAFVFIIWHKGLSQEYSKALPKVGDLINISEYYSSPESYQFNLSHNIWNLSFLQSNLAFQTQYEKSNRGNYYKYFPTSDLVLKKPNNEEEYYEIKNNNLYLVGKVIDVAFHKSGKWIINYGAGRQIFWTQWGKPTGLNVYEVELKFAKRDLILENSNFPNVDSIQITINVQERLGQREEGSLHFNSSSRKAQKQEMFVGSGMVFKTKHRSMKDWIVDNNYEPNQLPKEIQAVLDLPESRVVFVSNEFKGPTISYDVYEGRIKNLWYQNNVDEEISKSINEQSIIAYPVPSYGPTFIELINYPFDDYRIEITNVFGKQVWQKQFYKKDGRKFNLDLGVLRRGTYVYHVFDSKGRKLTTKRIVISGL